MLSVCSSGLLNNVSKTYELLVRERWPASRKRIIAPVLKNQLKSGQRVVVVDPKGKHSVTDFQILRSFKTNTLLQAFIVTGRTHQIRVHMSYLGHGIMGDDLYGKPIAQKFIKNSFLKSQNLSLIHI